MSVTRLPEPAAAFAGAVVVPPATVREPTSRRVPMTPRELWRYRELFVFLVWRDIKVRYAQTALGAAWMVFQPLAMLLVYTFAFGHLAKVTIPGVPYPLFALAGLTLWIFVSRGVMLGSDSLIHNIPIVTKTSSPRMIIPLAAVVALSSMLVTREELSDRARNGLSQIEVAAKRMVELVGTLLDFSLLLRRKLGLELSND